MMVANDLWFACRAEQKKQLQYITKFQFFFELGNLMAEFI